MQAIFNKLQSCLNQLKPPAGLGDVALALSGMPPKKRVQKTSALLSRLDLHGAFPLNAAAHQAAITVLKSKGVPYKLRRDNAILVQGDLDFSGDDLAALPDLSSVIVAGNFSCSRNRLTSLCGAPVFVGGDFRCSGNRLLNLHGAPKEVGGNFACSENLLETLEGAPETVGGSFYASDNQLQSLQGGPRRVGKDYHCRQNALPTLEGAPESVPGDFKCDDNELESLKGAPRTFAKLITDFGTFLTWDSIPGNLHRMPQPQDQTANAAILQEDIRILRPLRLKPS
ncbi:MAG: hypothetical protein ACAH83_00765 [Alphaproteobacteria bacterium]